MNGTVAYDALKQVFTVVGSNTYPEEGVYAVRVSVRDAGGAVATAGGLASVVTSVVDRTSLPVTAVETVQYLGPMVDFRLADPREQVSGESVTIAWGDGESAQGSIALDGQGGYWVVGSHTYRAAGSYVATVTVQDASGVLFGTSVSVLVSPLPATGTGPDASTGPVSTGGTTTGNGTSGVTSSTGGTGTGSGSTGGTGLIFLGALRFRRRRNQARLEDGGGKACGFGRSGGQPAEQVDRFRACRDEVHFKRPAMSPPGSGRPAPRVRRNRTKRR